MPAATSQQLADLESFSKTLQLSASEVEERIQIVHRVTTAVAKSLHLSPSGVVCVGSFACGLATAESDIDLAIVKPLQQSACSGTAGGGNGSSSPVEKNGDAAVVDTVVGAHDRCDDVEGMGTPCC